MEFAHLEGVQKGFYLAVNELIVDKLENIYSSKAEHSGFLKYSLKLFKLMVSFFLKPCRGIISFCKATNPGEGKTLNSKPEVCSSEESVAY